jgi:hypothetical protein
MVVKGLIPSKEATMRPNKTCNRKALFLSLFLLIIAVLIPSSSFAQSYYFQNPETIVNVYWNEDGTSSIDYLFTLVNDPSAPPIEFVDVGVPNDNYDLNSVYADVDGQEVTNIETSPYVSPGVAVGLGSYSIQPGDTGKVRVFIARVRDVLYPDDQDSNYVSAVFKTSYFDKSSVYGPTDLTVIYHFPPGVQPEEPRWHSAPSGFPSEPDTGFDDEDRVVYAWRNQSANAYTAYQFGASFPSQYVPQTVVVQEGGGGGVGILAAIGGIISALFFPLLCIGGVVLFFYWIISADRRRKLQYLPPKISIEGHGIKRGLTAVEAGILMEQPIEKLMTMTLFGVLKKEAAQVIKRDPLEIKNSDPLPEDLYSYEKDFLIAFQEPAGAGRKKALQKMMVDLVKSVGEKMKGFSRKETVAYYKDIMERAWAQVEAAGTPEVKSAKFDEVMEWTMLDKDYGDRTREVFHQGPVFVPVWWPRYDPSFGKPSGGTVSSGSSGGSLSMPHLPGSDFAAGIALGVQNFSSKVVGNIGDFTSGITNITNPPPKPPASSGRSYSSGRSGGSGCACACACACAGCACACAGGGR